VAQIASLFSPSKYGKEVDGICLNIQRVCYKGHKSIFKTRPEPEAGKKWEDLIKNALKQLYPDGNFVKVVSAAQYGQYSVLFVR
jgi:hypothetical protein